MKTKAATVSTTKKKKRSTPTKKPAKAKRVPLPPHLQELEDQLKAEKKTLKKNKSLPNEVKELKKLFDSVPSSVRRQRWANSLLKCLTSERSAVLEATFNLLFHVLSDTRIENGVTRGGALASLSTMGTEIERKFLVNPEEEDALRSFLTELKPVFITQAYLSEKEPGLLRVRISEYGEDQAEATLTIKGSGLLSRKEFEFPIPLDQAHEMMDALGKALVMKKRYRIPFKGHTFEVDMFYANNQILIEVELRSEDEKVDLPDWVGPEVTSDKKYSNASIAKNGWPWTPGTGVINPRGVKKEETPTDLERDPDLTNFH